MSSLKSRSISVLYEQQAEIYAKIARDRVFESEVKALIHSANRNRNAPVTTAVDLFAGPAWHALMFQKLDIVSYAIDISPAMADIAISAGYPRSRYVVGELPGAVRKLREPIDLAVAMRYSIGYLSVNQLVSLFRELRSVMPRDSIFFIELHRPDLIEGRFDALKIRARRFSLPDGREAECLWPYGGLKWDRMSATVEMVVLIRTTGDRPVKLFEFTSRELIYSAADIQAVSSAAGGWLIRPRDNILHCDFSQSEVHCLVAV
jgi:hypothetical protein